MTTLENLYCGNIFPADKDIKCGSEYSKLLNLMTRNEEKLKYNYTRHTQNAHEVITNLIGVLFYPL